jgi:dCMP deaminase
MRHVGIVVRDMVSGVVETHLGDAVYATFDGWHIWLRTWDGNNQRVALEPSVLDNLFAFNEHLRDKKLCGARKKLITAKWDRWFMGLARYASTASKDPSTRVGAALVGLDRRNIAIGYNGFAPGIKDDERLYDRATKYKLMIHAEENALNNALFAPDGATLYCPLHPCLRCARAIEARRVARVVTGPMPPIEPDKWTAEIPDAAALLAEAGVVVDIIGEDGA